MYSYEDILKRMKDQFTSSAGYSPDDASDIGIRMKVLAGEVYSVCSSIDWLNMQTFAQSAQGSQLDLRAQERGLQRESFVATASDYGLSGREAQFGMNGQGSAEERRAAIIKLGAITPNDFTKAGMERILSIAGLDAAVYEDTAAKKLYVNCLGESKDQTAREAAMKISNLFLPAHLNAELDFRSISWNNIDQAEDAFDTVDALDLSWDEIDNYENAMLQL